MDYSYRVEDIKALNLILVASGSNGLLNSFLTFLQKRISIYFCENNSRLYDLDLLYKAEVNPELLKKSHRLYFEKSKRVCNKYYLGYFDHYDYTLIYDSLYRSPKDSFYIPKDNYYNKKALLKTIYEKFDSDYYDSTSMISDFEIEYNYEKTDVDHSYVKLRCSISDHYINGEFLKHIKWFDSLIKELDFKYENCFHSAYISYNYPAFSILHTSIYNRYRTTFLNTYALGIEWSGYVNNRIIDHLNLSKLDEGSKTMSVLSLKNGKQYRANCDIQAFDKNIRNKLTHELSTLLMPAIGIYSWAELYNQVRTVSYLPEKIYVYTDTYSINDPTIVFSYEMMVDQISVYDELSDLKLITIVTIDNEAQEGGSPEKTG